MAELSPGILGHCLSKQPQDPRLTLFLPPTLLEIPSVIQLIQGRGSFKAGPWGQSWARLQFHPAPLCGRHCPHSRGRQPWEHSRKDGTGSCGKGRSILFLKEEVAQSVCQSPYRMLVCHTRLITPTPQIQSLDEMT